MSWCVCMLHKYDNDVWADLISWIESRETFQLIMGQVLCVTKVGCSDWCLKNSDEIASFYHTLDFRLHPHRRQYSTTIYILLNPNIIKLITWAEHYATKRSCLVSLDANPAEPRRGLIPGMVIYDVSIWWLIWFQRNVTAMDIKCVVWEDQNHDTRVTNVGKSFW